MGDDCGGMPRSGHQCRRSLAAYYMRADKNGPFRCARHENTLSPMRSLQYQNNPSHAAAARPRTHSFPNNHARSSRSLAQSIESAWLSEKAAR